MITVKDYFEKLKPGDEFTVVASIDDWDGEWISLQKHGFKFQVIKIEDEFLHIEELSTSSTYSQHKDSQIFTRSIMDLKSIRRNTIKDLLND